MNAQLNLILARRRTTDAVGQVSEFSTGSAAGSDPGWIAARPDGDLWFTDFDNSGTKGQDATTTAAITVQSAPPPPPTPALSALDITPRMFTLTGRRVGGGVSRYPRPRPPTGSLANGSRRHSSSSAEWGRSRDVLASNDEAPEGRS